MFDFFHLHLRERDVKYGVYVLYCACTSIVYNIAWVS